MIKFSASSRVSFFRFFPMRAAMLKPAPRTEKIKIMILCDIRQLELRTTDGGSGRIFIFSKRYGIQLKVKNDFAAAKVIKLLGKGRH